MASWQVKSSLRESKLLLSYSRGGVRSAGLIFDSVAIVRGQVLDMVTAAICVSHECVSDRKEWRIEYVWPIR